MSEDIVCYNLKVPRTIWDNFKDTLKKTDIINDIVIEMLIEKTNKFKKNNNL